MDEYKSLNKYYSKKKDNKIKKDNKSILYTILNKCLISGFILVLSLCITKIIPKSKEYIYKNVYQDNISFAKINEMYKKYLGTILPFDDILVEPTKTVFNEEFVYNNLEKYKEGVKITVDNNYLMPVLDSGIVVYKGEKENYGQTIIVQQVNGIDLWYVNVKNDSIKLYDYIEKGSLLGECINNEIYLYYQKNGEFLDYNEYLT